jgi:hypothetical protein
MAGKNVISESDDDQVTSVDPKDQVEEVIEVEEEPAVVAEPEVAEAADDRVAHDDGEDDEEEPAADPKRAKETAKARRERARAAKERDKRQLAAQEALIDEQNRAIFAMHESVKKVQADALDQRIAAHVRDAKTMEDIEKKALTANNGEDAVTARQLKEQNVAEAHRLAAEKDAILKPAPTQSGPPREVLDKQRIFMERHPWYNPNGTDEDTAITKAIDQTIAREGKYKPSQPEYWGELEKRIAARLPNRAYGFEAADDDAEPAPDTRTRRAPPVGGGRSAPSTGVTRLPLSPERVAAMKEAGYWDDPKIRTKMAKQYIAFDKARANQN